MAVRVIDVTDNEPAALRLVEPAPGRNDLRRLRQTWGAVGVLSLTLPFVFALVTLFVVR